MPANDIIKNADYNTLRSSIIPIIGNGTATFGYGQTVQSSDKATHEKISQTDWDLLRFDIVNARTHQDGVAPTITDINEGQILSFSNNTQYSGLITTASTNRFNIGSGRFLTESAVSSTRSTQWNTLVLCEVTVTFPNANLCRWFFNSGGQIRIQSSRTGGAGTSQNSDWSSLLASAGLQGFGSQTPTTGFSPMNGQNFYRLTNSYQNFYSLSSSAPYSANSYHLDARCDVADNSAGTATTVYIRVRFVDNYVDVFNVPPLPTQTGSASSFPPDDVVDGTLTVTVTERRATGSLLPSGTFTITRPTYTITAIGGA
jgi:hypothetical protein